MVKKGDLVLIGVFAGVVVGILIAALVLFGIHWYKLRARHRRCANEQCQTTVPIRTNGIDTSIESSASINNRGPQYIVKGSHSSSWWSRPTKDKFTSASCIPRYSYKDIQKATENFTTVLGQGSFGPVYKATLPNGGVVAVKTLGANSRQGEKEFQTEVTLLGRLHHRNLVNLLGYCVDKGQHMLIYEFMSNGSLENYLYNAEQALSWEERLQIAFDISHGIEYLHDGAVPPVIHRDLKCANILLDHAMRAKVADFGLSKEELYDGSNSGLKGTYDYIDPVYISTNKFTTKSDIYSFGIILFELITAIHPHQNLMEYVKLASMSPDGIDEIVDKQIVGTCNPQEVRKLAAIAHKCLKKAPRKRPSIAEISHAISKVKHKGILREDTMSFAQGDISRMTSRIEMQQVEIGNMGSLKENEAK
ncbi:unnamed protein product [Cuscuta campestris]|uniref:Protein kinase domain-containing protein n=1 Tax=Cuscuta campestris TaxID=132261 RepID=A0A484LYH1_9ASTE|nr:unnamed protein product [Cuscuta campestris]